VKQFGKWNADLLELKEEIQN